jgi:hypothetical protein
VDAGPGHRADRRAVPRSLHAARRIVPAAPDRVQPAGPGAPGRRAQRGRDRRMAGGDPGVGTRPAAATGAWICLEGEAGQALRPPRARTWGRRGRTPVASVPGKGSGRVPVAGPACLKTGAPGRFSYRLRVRRGRKGERRGVSEADYAGLTAAARRALAAPVILIWDNLDTRRGKAVREFHRRAPGLAHRHPAGRLRARPQPGRGRLAEHEQRPGRPRRPHPRPAHGDGQEPPPAHSAPPRAHHRIPRPDRTRPRTRTALTLRPRHFNLW